MTYEIIATGSTGNAVLINGAYLIDCGVTWKKIEPYARRLVAVLLTHEHGDHFKASTIKRLAYERPTLRFGCLYECMANKLLAAGVTPDRIDLFKPGAVYGYGGLRPLCVEPFELQHDVPNCGYKLYANDGSSLFFATDTGTLDGISAKGFDLYLVEANHTRAEIEAAVAAAQACGEYSYRVKAAQNHLSYEQAMDWLAENMGPTSLWVPLHGHQDKKKGGADDGRAPDVRKDDSAI